MYFFNSLLFINCDDFVISGGIKLSDCEIRNF